MSNDQIIDESAPAAALEHQPSTSRWQEVAFPVTAYLAIGAVIMVLAWVSYRFMDGWVSYAVKNPYKFRGDHIFGGWMRYDAYWYTDIANNGYSHDPGKASSVAFFPAYPLSVRMLGLLLTDNVLAGILLTFSSGLAFAIFFYRWCLRKMESRPARLAVLLLLTYPYAYYLYGAVYADAFFLMFAALAFLLLEKDRVLLAGLAAAVAGAARPVGLAVFVGLVAVEIERRGILVIPFLDRMRSKNGSSPGGDPSPATDRRRISVALRRVRVVDFALLLSLSGWALWCGYLWRAFGDPFLYVAVEGAPGWDQEQGPSTWFKAHWIDLLSQYNHFIHDRVQSWDNLVYTTNVSFQAVLAVAFLASIPLVIRRLGWGYAVYVLVIVAIPVLGTKDWQGTGRYLLAGFPVFAALAMWLVDRRHRVLRTLLLVASASLLLLFTSAFARGYYLS